MTVRGYLALLVGVFVVALAGVAVAQRNVVGDLGDVVRDAAGSSAPRARAAGELRTSYLAEEAALAEADRLLAAEQAAADRAMELRRSGSRGAGKVPPGLCGRACRPGAVRPGGGGGRAGRVAGGRAGRGAPGQAGPHRGGDRP